MEKIAELFSKNLRAFRTARGFTQDALSERLGLAVHSIQNYEAGRRKPDFETLGRIAKQLNVGTWELLRPEGAEDTAAAREIQILTEQVEDLQGQIARLFAPRRVRSDTSRKPEPDFPAKSIVLAPIAGWDVLAQELRQLSQGDAAELVGHWLGELRLFQAALKRQKLGDDSRQGEPDKA